MRFLGILVITIASTLLAAPVFGEDKCSDILAHGVWTGLGYTDDQKLSAYSRFASQFSSAEAFQKASQDYGVDLDKWQGNASIEQATQQRSASWFQQFNQNLNQSHSTAITVLNAADKNIVKAWKSCMSVGGWKTGVIFSGTPSQVYFDNVFASDVKPYSLEITEIKAETKGAQCDSKSVTLDRGHKYIKCTGRDPYAPLEVKFVSDRYGERIVTVPPLPPPFPIEVELVNLPGKQCITDDHGACLIARWEVPPTAPNTRIQISAELDVMLLVDNRKGDPHRRGGLFITFSPGDLRSLREQCEKGGPEWCADFRQDDTRQATARMAVKRTYENSRGSAFTVYLYGYTRDGTQMLRNNDTLGNIRITRE